MLQTSTVEPATLGLLKRLMDLPELKHFSLVGGTCLALRYGHRQSVDLDLFSTVQFNNEDVIQALERNFPGFTYRNASNPVGVFGFIDDVKVDFVQHHYFKQIAPLVLEDRIRMFGDPDIIAMKVFAIMKRAQKKDFWDIAELLKHYSIQDFIDYYTKKYPNTQLLISIPQAISYFDDAEESEDPVSLKGQTWEQVKQNIRREVSNYLR